MCYEPQMTNEELSNLYKELSNEFATKPFDEVMNRCRDIVKKYFSCFPLLYRMGILYLNYCLISKDEEQKKSTIAEAKVLFIRVKEQSDDIELKQLALHLEATCETLLCNPNKIIDLLKNVKTAPPHKDLLAQAYLMTGKIKEAKMEFQESIYIDIMKLINTLPQYISICADDAEHFEVICKRGMELIDTFNLRELEPTSIMPFYLAAAQGYLTNKKSEKSLDILETYTNLVTSDIYPLKVMKVDKFFNLIKFSSENLPFGRTELPRNEKSIKQSMADAVIENPVFSILSDEPRFKKLTKKLINNIGGN
jgi:tetratricopeptide (TPR) repeat protein